MGFKAIIKGTLFKQCFFKAMHHFSEPVYNIFFFSYVTLLIQQGTKCINIYGIWQLLKIGGQCENTYFFKTEEFFSIRSKDSLQQSVHLLGLIKPLKAFQFSPSPLFSTQQLHLPHQKQQLLEIRAITTCDGMNPLKVK